MFRQSCLRLPKRYIEETTHMARRVRAKPTRPMWYGREEDYTDRMKEMGPRDSKVWVALGGCMRRRRIGRGQTSKDARYYWRPIERQYQRIYLRKLRTRDYSNKHRSPLTMRPSNWETSNETCGPIHFREVAKKYGTKYAAAKPLDFEFRVF